MLEILYLVRQVIEVIFFINSNSIFAIRYLLVSTLLKVNAIPK